jgi:type IV pilus assembly protein PilA
MSSVESQCRSFERRTHLRCAQSELGLTLLELLFVVGIVGVLSALSVPPLLRARQSANEASTIESLRAVNAAESAYAMSCGHSGYAQTLPDLASPADGTTQGFISPDLAAPGSKSGYLINLAPGADAAQVADASASCNHSRADAVSAYFAEAHPLNAGWTGGRSFGTDTNGTIYARDDGTTVTISFDGASPLGVQGFGSGGQTSGSGSGGGGASDAKK